MHRALAVCALLLAPALLAGCLRAPWDPCSRLNPNGADCSYGYGGTTAVAVYDAPWNATLVRDALAATELGVEGWSSDFVESPRVDAARAIARPGNEGAWTLQVQFDVPVDHFLTRDQLDRRAEAHRDRVKARFETLRAAFEAVGGWNVTRVDWQPMMVVA